MIPITAYQCEICKKPYLEADAAKKCDKACNKKLERKRKSQAYQAKVKKQSDWIRLNIKSIDDLENMIIKFYKRTQKVDIKTNISRLKIKDNILSFYIEAKAIDGKSPVNMSGITSGRWSNIYNGTITASGFDLDGAGSGHGYGFNAGCKLDLTQCPHIKKLIDERKELDDKAREYSRLLREVTIRAEEMVKNDEEYRAHKNRYEVFSVYAKLADKLASERGGKIMSKAHQNLVKELIPDDIRKAHERHSELSNLLKIDNY